jgi:site-specific recombinase XerD
MRRGVGRTPKVKHRLFLKCFQEHNDQVAALVGLQYMAGTLTKFKPVLRHTQGFIEWKYGRRDISIRRIDHVFVADLDFWLKSAKKIDHNTTMKYLACCRKIILRCMRNGWLTRDPFLGFSLAQHEVQRQALTDGEMEAIIKACLSSERLEQVRDVFLFYCYTGLAYADVKKLRTTDIIKGFDGRPWISVRRQKTETPSRVPLLAPALQILDRYSSHDDIWDNEQMLPVTSNQKMNAYLKEIADQCGITKRMTVHLARHTFATTVALSNGVPMETVSKMLGHRSLRTTQQYAKIVDRKVSQDMEAIHAKFGGGRQ